MSKHTVSFVVRGRSLRTGAVMWLRTDATPTDYRSEAGLFDRPDAAELAAQEFRASLERVVGACRWSLNVVCAEVRS